MKKYLLALFLVLLLCVPVFANSHYGGTYNTYNDQTYNQGGAGGNATATGGSVIGSGNSFNSLSNKTDVDLTFRPTNTNIGVNDVNNHQVISPKQETSTKVESPVQLPLVNTPGLPELNYGNGRIKFNGFPFEFNTDLPEFDSKTMRISGQVDQKANIPMKSFFGEAADLLVKYSGQQGLAYITMVVEANKTLQGGVNFNGLGSGVSAAGTGGGGGGGLLGIQGGITKAHDLGTIIIVKVVAAKQAKRTDLWERYAQEKPKTKVLYEAKPTVEIPSIGTSILK